MKCQMFWKCMELVAADSPTRAVSWVRAWWFILSPIDTCTCARALSPAKYTSSSFALIFLSLLFSHESFLIFRGLGHSLVLLLRLRSFPPTTYNVTRLGKTEFLVPFSCLHRQHCRIVQTRQSSRKFLKGINDRDRWESCQSTTEKSNHCYSCHNCQFSNMILRKSSVTRLSWCLK